MNSGITGFRFIFRSTTGVGLIEVKYPELEFLVAGLPGAWLYL